MGDEAVDTVPVIGGKLEAKGKGARIQLDDVKLEADGTLSTQKEGTLVFARSKKNKHRRRGQKKHTIQLGGSFADLSTTDATKIKEGKKELRDKTDVEEELTKEDDSTDDSAQEMTVTNLQRMLKARGVLPADGSGDSSCDTVQKATRKMAKYVRAKKKVLPMLRRSKTITKSKGQVFDEADVTKALQETESTDEGKALAASKSTRWERYKSLAEKGRVSTWLQRKGFKKEGHMALTSEEKGTIQIEIKKRSSSACVYGTVVEEGCTCTTGYQGDACDTEKTDNTPALQATLRESQISTLALMLEEEEEEEITKSTVVVDESSTMEIEDGAEVEVVGGVTTIRGKLALKEGATMSVKKSAVVDLRSSDEESIDVKPLLKSEGEESADEGTATRKTSAIQGDLEVGDNAIIKVDSLKTKGSGRFLVGGKATLQISKDPRQIKVGSTSAEETEPCGDMLGETSSKKKAKGKSRLEKTLRKRKKQHKNAIALLAEVTTTAAQEAPTVDVLNQALRGLGVMKAVKTDEPDVDETAARSKLSKAYHVRRRAKSLVCSDRAVRRGKEKAVTNTDKKRCKEMEPTVAELKAAIEGRGVDLTTVLANVQDNSDKVTQWQLYVAASRMRVMSRMMAKIGAYKEKTAEVEDAKTREERKASMLATLKKSLLARKKHKLRQRKKNKAVQEIEEEEEKNAPVESAAVMEQKEDIEKERQCLDTCAVGITPTCDPGCLKCEILEPVCDACGSAVCLDKVEKDVEDLSTLDAVLAEIEKDEDEEIDAKDGSNDFEVAADAKVDIEGGTLVLAGQGDIRGTVAVDATGIIVCDRGAFIDMTSDDEDDTTSNAAEEEEGAADVVEKSDDPNDDTPQATIDGTIELGEGSKLDVDSLTLGPTGVIAGSGELRILSDPRTVAVVEESNGGAKKEKKWRSKKKKKKKKKVLCFDTTA